MTMAHKRLLIVDDQTLFAQTLKQTLEIDGQYAVEVSTSTDRRDIMESIRRVAPTTILLDVHLGQLSGLDLAEEILVRHPTVFVLMLTAFGYDEYVKRAQAIGTSGILLKDISVDDLVDAINGASKNTFIVTQRRPIESTWSRSGDEPGWIGYLTENEQRLLRLVVQGYSNDEISGVLNLGRQTVKNYVSGLYKKMDVENRFHAIRTAIEDYPELFSRKY